MAFRAYDPCFGCATHSQPGRMPLIIRVRDRGGNPVAVFGRNADGRLERSHEAGITDRSLL